MPLYGHEYTEWVDHLRDVEGVRCPDCGQMYLEGEPDNGECWACAEEAESLLAEQNRDYNRIVSDGLRNYR